MDQRLLTLLADLQRVDSLSAIDQTRCARRAKWLAEADEPQLREFFAGVAAFEMPLSARADSLLQAALAACVEQLRLDSAVQKARGEFSDNAALRASLVELYQNLGSTSRARHQLLIWLAIAGGKGDLSALAAQLVDDPPREEEDIVRSLAALFTQRGYPIDALFPKLLEALASPLLAAPVLDLANYLTREKRTAEHPATSRKQELIELLGRMAESLGRMEERPQELDESPIELSRRIAGSVALTVSLCDALAQIGDDAAVPKLFQVLELGHRRLRTEAAAALARLGEKQGAEELIKMAAEPVARLRALAYAAELGISEKIDAKHRTSEARSEAELTLWLAEPTQFGVPPTECELFDQRRQFWPGFAAAVDCFLWRFSYTITLEGEGERTYSNIGIAGPLVHAFTADLADLPPDDIYAAYAGWHASHEEIIEHDVERLSRSEKTEVARLERRLHDAGYTSITAQQMGYFFGERALVALADRDGLPGVAVVDFQDTLFFPKRNPRRPLGPREAYCIYKGRKLLRTFNRVE